MAFPGVSGVCVLSVCVLLLSRGHCSPIASPEGPGAHAVVDTVDMQEVLGQFLHMLNASAQGPLRSRPRSSRTEPPEYMLELYNRFASDRSAAPAANIVRSFRNEEHMSESRRTHRLLFNVSVPRHESIVSAELRLHVLLKRDPRQRTASSWRVTVSDGRYGTGERGPLASKHIHRKDSGWEAFDMTNAVRHWRKLNMVTPRMEVQIESLDPCGNTNDWPHADLDIDRNPDGKHQPALVVFSDDQTEVPQREPLTNEHKDQEEAPLTQIGSNAIYEDGSRVRRSAKVEDCRIAEMYVDFKDIGWDSFILAPAGYQAYTCRGVCSYPLVPEVTPTKHAIVRTLLNLHSPQRATKACCVPTQLKPISVLYENENGVVVLDNKYEGMVVKECGCR